jgi:hypothetical protein
MIKILKRIVFIASLIAIAVFLWAVTFGQIINVDFRDAELSNVFYMALFWGFPAALLLTLFGTLKRAQPGRIRILIVLLTVGASIGTFVFLLSNIFIIGFGQWSTFNISYEHRDDPGRQVHEQRYDIGALGYGHSRVVEVAPFAFFFWKTKAVDTTTLDPAAWRRVDREADVHFP